jgi:5-methylcytosine-specific restriction protein A
MSETVTAFDVSSLYSNEQIFKSLGVGNTGGIRVKRGADGEIKRIAIFTSIPTARQLAENPYHDRMEGDTLIYTGAGKAGEQVVSGANARIVEQQLKKFPIYAFIQMAGRRDRSVGVRRWGFLGLLEYLRGYQESQLDARKEKRNAWMFEFRVHTVPMSVSLAKDAEIMRMLLETAQSANDEDRDVVSRVGETTDTSDTNLVELEDVRKKLLAYNPEHFEHVISDVLRFSGFDKVDVTRYSQDGGIDINARLERNVWPLRHLLTQIQAKRWLHCRA